MDTVAALVSIFGPTIAGGYLLRLAGCRWRRVAFGSAMCFAIAMLVLFFLWRAAERYGWDMETAVLFLPFIEAAAFAFLIWQPPGWRNPVSHH
ncbi:MAG: hypothetical protein Q7R40_17090 [Phaeospirillum sp.]|nr:hypothetical protein [Phaeospirillum sp.]